jgi:hypothetical protein
VTADAPFIWDAWPLRTEVYFCHQTQNECGKKVLVILDSIETQKHLGFPGNFSSMNKSRKNKTHEK